MINTFASLYKMKTAFHF